MKSIVSVLAVSLVLGLAGGAAAEPIKFARYPHVSQGKLVFSYHGDIWIANENGSNPVRLTAHVARDTFPRLSPDGRWVAFTSDRFGNDDVFVIPAAGGEPKQLTFSTGGRHRPELDARRQGRAHHDAVRHQPVAQSAPRSCRSTAACRRRSTWTAACRA